MFPDKTYCISPYKIYTQIIKLPESQNRAGEIDNARNRFYVKSNRDLFMKVTKNVSSSTNYNQQQVLKSNSA